MTEIPLDVPFLEGGVDNVNFSNGRVLTAEDLRDEQAAGVIHHHRLGSIGGPGVLAGLTVVPVTGGVSVLVGAGSAVTPRGDVLELTTDPVEVPLTVAPETATNGSCESGPFAPCEEPGSDTTRAGDGIYLFVISPATGQRGRAPVVGVGSAGVSQECGPRYTVEGVAFHLVAVDAAELATAAGFDADASAALETAVGEAARVRRRNVLAHLFLDTEALRAGLADPLGTGPAVQPGTLATLAGAGRLTDCDVPLALLSWEEGAIEFTDTWAVRRRLAPAHAPPRGWRQLLASRRPADAEAALFQHHDQLAELTGAGTSDDALLALRAVDHFRWLPPAGLIAATDGIVRGVDFLEYFRTVPFHGPEALPVERLERLLQSALAAPSVDLRSGLVVRLYELRDPLGTPVDPEPRPRRLAFVSAHVPQPGRTLEIRAIRPPGPIAPGKEIALIGAGYLGANEVTVTVDNTAANVTDMPQEDELFIEIPPALTAPAEGRLVDIALVRGDEHETVFVLLLPGDALGGELAVELDAGVLRFEAGRLLGEILVTVTSRLTLEADVTVEIDVRPQNRLRHGGPETVTLAPGAAEEVGFEVEGRILGAAGFTVTATARADGISARAKRKVRTRL